MFEESCMIDGSKSVLIILENYQKQCADHLLRLLANPALNEASCKLSRWLEIRNLLRLSSLST